MSELPAQAGPGSGIKGEVIIKELSRRERSAARRSAETRAIVPSIELTSTVDMEAALTRAESEQCPLIVVVITAVAGALKLMPRLNGAYRDGRHEFYSRVNIAVPVGDGDGRALATLFDADSRTLGELAAELEALRERASEGELVAADAAGATFTVVPPLAEGVRTLTPLIQPPQAATLAIGAVIRAPVARGKALHVGHVADLTLACDHRIVQDVHGAAFLGAVKDRLETPSP